MNWDYDVGCEWRQRRVRKKHWWDEPAAGVRDETIKGKRVQRVACCPNDVSFDEARQILNEGIPYWDEIENEGISPPDRIYTVFRGVPYETRHTRKGLSFHGFPILPERYDALPDSVKTALAERAGGTETIDQWLETWRPKPTKGS